jgi:hypothetical protein
MSRSAWLARKIALLVVMAALRLPLLAQFEAGSTVAAPDTPFSIATGDFNHDGKLDLAVASVEAPSGEAYGTEVQVLLGNGNGTFQKAVSYPVGTQPNSVYAADVNGDGNLDLVVTNEVSDSFSVLLGRGDGTFQTALNYSTPPDPIYITVADFNGDGKLDVATINLSDSSGRCDCVAIFLGNGDGTFQEAPIITTASQTPFAIGVGQFKSGGALDIAVAEEFGATSQVEILLGNGDGTFTSGQILSVDAGPQSIAVADFNGDHKPDLAVAEFEGESVRILIGNGNGTFRKGGRYVTEFPDWVTAADLTGSGKQDLVTAAFGVNLAGGVSVLMGKGDGTFQGEKFYPAGDQNFVVATGDFNGDNKADIAFTATGSTYVGVLLNTGVVTFSPTTPLSFSKQKVGTTSAPQKVTLTNTGTTTLKIFSMKATGQFGMSSTCGASVKASGNCTISVTFSPTSQGAKSGTVTIQDSASSKPMLIELSGTGT